MTAMIQYVFPAIDDRGEPKVAIPYVDEEPPLSMVLEALAEMGYPMDPTPVPVSVTRSPALSGDDDYTD